MASAEHDKKLRILLIPFFASSHISPYTDLAVSLAATNSGVVEPTMAVTLSNVPVVRSALERHVASLVSSGVMIATYPFPDMDGLPRVVEYLTAAVVDAWRIDAAAIDKALMRPAQEALVRELSFDAVVIDIHFFWNSIVVGELGVPCVMFGVIGPFSSLAMRHLEGTVYEEEVIVPGFPGPEIRVPRNELLEFLRCQQKQYQFSYDPCSAKEARSFSFVFNALLDMEQKYCKLYVLVF